MCYRAEFGRSALKGAGIITGKPPNWGALELCGAGIRCVADPKIHASPPRVTTQKLIVLR